MANYKQNIDLSNQNITYTENTKQHKLLKFLPKKMTVDVLITDKNANNEIKNLPFAHLPKKIKKIIKPN